MDSKPSELWDGYSDGYLDKLPDICIFMTPVVWEVLFGISFILYHTGILHMIGINHGWFYSTVLGVGALVALILTVLVVAGGTFLFFKGIFALVPKNLRFFSLSDWWKGKQSQWNAEMREEQDRKRRERARLRAAKIDMIACPVGPDAKPLKARVEELPKDLKTVRLRWTGFKKKYCQPFAR